MFVIKCFKCKEVLGGVLNPGSIPFIICMHCGFENHTSICIDKEDYYVDCREADINKDSEARDANLRDTLFKQDVLV